MNPLLRSTSRICVNEQDGLVKFNIHYKETFPSLSVPQLVLYKSLTYCNLIELEVKKGLEIIKRNIRDYSDDIISMSKQIGHCTDPEFFSLRSFADALTTLAYEEEIEKIMKDKGISMYEAIFGEDDELKEMK